ncbi:coenzyme F420-dependent oxidoreductase domain protein [Mycobacterium ulcerans str. Harvey]|uniref:Coenzyme F420-dependent oxidoreductase domain protein n=1 Tax=Mycobacterium ulcerans str. Harvey TaxID=1299332 RepID=A0ABP3AQ74_MYCUL|nr:coenzyme F420-dependent oxidoreductase domain protein [Mycobacterium ulcerans str. Harvey]
MDVTVHASLAIGNDVEQRLARVKPQLALYLGGMGAKGRRFTTTWPLVTGTAMSQTESRSCTWLGASTRP